MLNLFIGSLQLLDTERRRLKAVIGLLVRLFLLGILAMVAIQYVMNVWLNPVNAVLGVGWMVFVISMVWQQGGRPLDAVLSIYAFSKGANKITAFNHALARVLIGFFTVWSFAVLFLVVVPFYASIVGFAAVLVGVPCYFLTRHMAGLTINWSRWVWVPQYTIGLGLAICIISAVAPFVTGTVWPAITGWFS